MPDLDEVSTAIGRLQATAEDQTRSLKDIRDVTQGIQRMLAEHATHSAARDQRLEALEDAMKKKVLPAIEDFAALRNRGIGALAVIGIVVSILTLAIERLASWVSTKFWPGA